MNLAALAEQSLMAATAIAQQTPVAWVLEVEWREPDGGFNRLLLIAEGPLADRPDGEELVPADCEFLRCDAFPASRFGDFAEPMRQRYRRHYSEYLLWQRAQELGLFSTADLKPWLHYDPIAVEAEVTKWVRPSTYFPGD